MKLGCCLNMLGNSEEPIGRAFIETAQEAGYEYVELPLAQVMELDRQEFDGLLAQLGESGICCRACNNFFPCHVMKSPLLFTKIKYLFKLFTYR